MANTITVSSTTKSEVQCPECLGSGKDQRGPNSVCSYCWGAGQISRARYTVPFEFKLPGTIKTPDEQIADLRAEVAELTRRIAALEAGET